MTYEYNRACLLLNEVSEWISGPVILTYKLSLSRVIQPVKEARRIVVDL